MSSLPIVPQLDELKSPFSLGALLHLVCEFAPPKRVKLGETSLTLVNTFTKSAFNVCKERLGWYDATRKRLKNQSNLTASPYPALTTFSGQRFSNQPSF
jgi:hypothetical protein